MLWKLLPLLGMLLLFTSCAQLDLAPENLMRPPKLTVEQSEISQALENAVGDDDIKYKYPQNGGSRSSFIFYDLDNDGQDEALVFYQAPSKGSSTWVNILDNTGSGWFSAFDMAAPGNEMDIDFISFEHLTSDIEKNIVIGWKDSYSESNIVMVYAYQNGHLENIFEQEYNKISLTDLNQDKKQDIVLLTIDEYADEAVASLVCRTESFTGEPVLSVVSTLQLSSGAVEIAQVLPGKADMNTNALFIDSYTNNRRANRAMVTDVIAAYNNELVNLLDDDTLSLSAQTARTTEVFCRDANEDNIIEIPTASPLPGYGEDYEGQPLFLVTYCHIGLESLEAVSSGVINADHRYMVTFPQRWIGNVTVVSQTENGEWAFVPYNGSFSDASPLLRIRVYSVKDYHDKFENKYFQLIGKQGLFEYYAYIPENSDPLKITTEELKSMFSFVNL